MVMTPGYLLALDRADAAALSANFDAVRTRAAAPPGSSVYPIFVGACLAGILVRPADDDALHVACEGKHAAAVRAAVLRRAETAHATVTELSLPS